MKKLLIMAAMAVASVGAQAQTKLFLSTYNGTNLEKYDGTTCDVTVNRQLFTGWNTLSLPFAMNEQELNDVFGSDCRLERLAGVEESGNDICLNFADCKRDGLQANTPYMLYYTGDIGTKTIRKETVVAQAPAVLTFTTASGDVVTMNGAQKHVDANGLYGVLAIDNSEVRFVAVDETTSGFYATRCYIQVASGTSKKLNARHLGYNETTTISAIATGEELVDVYNLQGNKVASQMRADQVNDLRPAIYIVKGHKVLVK